MTSEHKGEEKRQQAWTVTKKICIVLDTHDDEDDDGDARGSAVREREECT